MDGNQVYIPLAAVAEVLAVHAAGGYEQRTWRIINAGAGVTLCTIGALAHNPAALIASLAPAVVGVIESGVVIHNTANIDINGEV